MAEGEDAADFDTWYADMAQARDKDEITRRHLGLPPEVPSSSLLGWDALAEVTTALRLHPGDMLLDLACGRGGYGLEIARRTGAKLIGVDFSGEAIRQATGLADDLGRSAEFRVGELAATGLAAGSVDAVVCIDSIQFANPPEPAYAEIQRVLAPGGRVVITTWEANDRADSEVPERIRRADPATCLAETGFVEVVVTERSEWSGTERALWEEVAALEPDGDPALQSFQDEAFRMLRIWGRIRRVVATAQTPIETSQVRRHADQNGA